MANYIGWLLCGFIYLGSGYILYTYTLPCRQGVHIIERRRPAKTVYNPFGRYPYFCGNWIELNGIESWPLGLGIPLSLSSYDISGSSLGLNAN